MENANSIIAEPVIGNNKIADPVVGGQKVVETKTEVGPESLTIKIPLSSLEQVYLWHAGTGAKRIFFHMASTVVSTQDLPGDRFCVSDISSPIFTVEAFWHGITFPVHVKHLRVCYGDTPIVDYTNSNEEVDSFSTKDKFLIGTDTQMRLTWEIDAKYRFDSACSQVKTVLRPVHHYSMAFP